MLLLDEPCSALDPIATAKIEELLFHIKDNCTVVIVTHNMQQAARIADYTGFFLMGRLMEFDTAEVIFKNSQGEVDRRLHHRPFRLIAFARRGKEDLNGSSQCRPNYVISIKNWNN